MNISAYCAAITVATLGLLSACAGNAGSQAGGDKFASATAVDPTAVTCKSIIKTGTRIGTRVCKMNRDWEQEQRDSREAAERIQRGAAQTQADGNGG